MWIWSRTNNRRSKARGADVEVPKEEAITEEGATEVEEAEEVAAGVGDVAVEMWFDAKANTQRIMRGRSLLLSHCHAWCRKVQRHCDSKTRGPMKPRRKDHNMMAEVLLGNRSMIEPKRRPRSDCKEMRNPQTDILSSSTPIGLYSCAQTTFLFSACDDWKQTRQYARVRT